MSKKSQAEMIAELLKTASLEHSIDSRERLPHSAIFRCEDGSTLGLNFDKKNGTLISKNYWDDTLVMDGELIAPSEYKTQLSHSTENSRVWQFIRDLPFPKKQVA